MTLHIFNPEHDIALASNLDNFTAPHAGRQLRHDLGFLPALWAEEGDVVMVDDVEHAKRMLEKLKVAGQRKRVLSKLSDCQFVTNAKAVECTEVSPWGWDRALRTRLKRGEVEACALPTDSQLDVIRELSHRRVAARLLPFLRRDNTVGETYECKSMEDVESLIKEKGRVVIKAPWSSSGRGIRFCDISFLDNQGKMNFSASHIGWLRNILTLQGSVMVEPYYNKVKDFGMEFNVSADGRVHYEGLSLFHTTNGAYTGNILATENTKQQLLGKYMSLTLINDMQMEICNHLSSIIGGRYQGPLGIDMMIVAGEDKGFFLHPCVEINLRRTMGHVALAMTPQDDDIVAVMRIEYANGSYQMKLSGIHKNNILEC